MNAPRYRKIATVEATPATEPGVIQTLEGDHTYEAGDYICGPGVAGEYWPVRKDIFEATYVLDEARAPLEAELSTLREAHEESERLLDRIEQRAALLPIGLDGGASRKTLRLQGIMLAHWIAEQRAAAVVE